MTQRARLRPQRLALGIVPFAACLLGCHGTEDRPAYATNLGELGGSSSVVDGNSAGPSGATGGIGGASTSGTNERPFDAATSSPGLSWPIDCVPNATCLSVGYPDIDNDGLAFNCGASGYAGHEGTDIPITSEAMVAGIAVTAAADGIVAFAFDGKYDRCPNSAELDCHSPSSLEAGATTGTTVCTPLGPFCGTGTGSCFWCFAGGNVIVILHSNVPGVFATRYDHLKRDSVLVHPGDTITRGQKIAEVGSAGNSTGPHLHFEVWGTGYYELADPWAGPCGPNRGPALWTKNPPWQI